MQSNIKKKNKLKKKIIFICEANQKVGFGHLVRCNLLASIFYKNNYECYIFGIKKKFIENNYYKKIYQKFPISKKKININFIKDRVSLDNVFFIIDSFKINNFIERILLNHDIKWLQFDNFNNKKKIYADIIINANPLITINDYQKRVYEKKKQLFLVGKKFLIIRDEFKKKYTQKSKFILICSGGGTKDKNFIYNVLKIILRQNKKEDIVVILNANDPRINSLKKLNFNSNKVIFVQKTNNISKYFANSKIVYLSGGTVLIESLFYNLKRFALSIAKNQIKNCLAWEKKGFISYLGDLSIKKFNQKQVENKINSYSHQKNKVLNKKLIFGKELIYKSILRKF